MFTYCLVLLFAASISFALGYETASMTSVPIAHAAASPTDQTTLTQTATASSSESQGVSSQQSVQSMPTPTPANVFAYTPLPTNTGGPENDIIETQPMSESRSSAQVDDSITFSTTIKNQASYDKTLYSVCFESTDGNMGCIFTIHLAPGQSYSLQNVGTWIQGGEKDIWLTWSQDGQNYYQPLNASVAHVQILG